MRTPWIARFLIILFILTGTSLLFLSLKHDEQKSQTAHLKSAFLEARSQLAANKGARDLIITDFAIAQPLLTDWLRQDAPDYWYEALADEATDRQCITNVFADIQKLGAEIKNLKEKLNTADVVSTDLYIEACEIRRKLRLSKLMEKYPDIIFAQHHNFMMSFIGYTEGLSDARHERFFKPGAKLMQLTFDGLYGQTKTLLDDPHGMIRDADVSEDGKRILFAWKKSDRLDDYHIYEYNIHSSELRQLTHGIGRADYEPVYIPGGDIIFASTRPEQSVPCWWTEISNLYRMNGDGKYVRRLAIDQVHTLYPQVLENGRIIYTRWDYSDRGQNYPHPIFSMNPDGTDQRAFYGANSWFPTSLLHGRAIPGTGKVMAVAAGHHTRQRGKVVVLDTDKGRDEGKGMHFIAPIREVEYERVDRAQQHGDQFRYPYPISENEFLVSFLPTDSLNENRKYADTTTYHLYWMDHDGNRELLFADHRLSVGRSVPLNKPGRQKYLKDTVDYTQNTGFYYVHDVYEGVGLKGIARGTAKKIRVVRLNYRAAGVGQSRNQGEGGGSLNSSPVAIGNGSWDIKEILGDVNIETDGSALFEVPAMESIYLQVLDKKGRVIQTTRTWDTVRPGEKKGCKGCHAKEDANFYPFTQENTLAWENPPQKIQPFYGPTRGFSFIKEIQPILDQKCVQCHNGQDANIMNLSGEMKSHGTLEKRTWSESYLNLTHAELKERREQKFYAGDPENSVVNWISKMSKPTELDPYSFGAATSEMMHNLENGHHEVSLTEEEFHKLYAWLDLLVPFIGEYREAHDWTPEEMAYYDYYEYKRGKYQAEEMTAIKEWIAAQSGHVKAVKTQTEAKVKTTGYRRISAPLMMDKDEWEFTFPGIVMIDRIDFKGWTTNKPKLITLEFSDGSVIQGNLPAQSSTLMLDRPTETSDLIIKLNERPSGIEIWGIDVEELPSFQSHHPYRQLGGD